MGGYPRRAIVPAAHMGAVANAFKTDTLIRLQAPTRSHVVKRELGPAEAVAEAEARESEGAEA